MSEQLRLEFRQRDVRLQTMLDKLHAQYSVEIHQMKKLIEAEHDLDATDYQLQLAQAELMRDFVRHAIQEQIRGNYGVCKSCGEEIDEKELAALPFRIDCKTCEDRRTTGQLVTRSTSKFPLLKELG